MPNFACWQGLVLIIHNLHVGPWNAISGSARDAIDQMCRTDRRQPCLG
jgi:hypothetical protein